MREYFNDDTTMKRGIIESEGFYQWWCDYHSQEFHWNQAKLIDGIFKDARDKIDLKYEYIKVRS